MRDGNVEKFVDLVKEVRAERIDKRRKRRIFDREQEKQDEVALAFTQHPNLWDDKDDKPVGIQVFDKVKEVAGNVLKGKIDWAAVKKWISENWIKIIQIIIGIVGIAIAVGT